MNAIFKIKNLQKTFNPNSLFNVLLMSIDQYFVKHNAFLCKTIGSFIFIFWYNIFTPKKKERLIMEGRETLSAQDHAKLNKIFILMSSLSIIALLVIVVNSIDPEITYSYGSEANAIIKVSVSLLIFGIFACLNSCIMLVLKARKRSK